MHPPKPTSLTNRPTSTSTPSWRTTNFSPIRVGTRKLRTFGRLEAHFVCSDLPVALQQPSSRLATSRNGLGIRVLQGGRARLSELEFRDLSISSGTLAGNQISYQLMSGGFQLMRTQVRSSLDDKENSLTSALGVLSTHSIMRYHWITYPMPRSGRSRNLGLGAFLPRCGGSTRLQIL